MRSIYNKPLVRCIYVTNPSQELQQTKVAMGLHRSLMTLRSLDSKRRISPKVSKRFSILAIFSRGLGLMSLFGDFFHITKTAISVGDEISPRVGWCEPWGHQSQPLFRLIMVGFRFVIGVPPVIIHFEGWAFPVHKNPSSELGGTPHAYGNTHNNHYYPLLTMDFPTINHRKPP